MLDAAADPWRLSPDGADGTPCTPPASAVGDARAAHADSDDARCRSDGAADSDRPSMSDDPRPPAMPLTADAAAADGPREPVTASGSAKGLWSGARWRFAAG